MMRSPFTAIGLTALLWACGPETPPPAGNQAAAALPANSAVAATNSAEAGAALPTGSLRLAGNGLAPGILFGMPQQQAEVAATAAFGAPTEKGGNDECGAGPMYFIDFHDLQLGFQQGRLVGWVLDGNQPVLRTDGGLAVGTPRSALAGIEIDEQSSLGPEFNVDGVGGILNETGTRIDLLYAGVTCFFR
jgi:hypothetical protein